MDQHVEGLEAWEQQLRRAEQDLHDREQQALIRDPNPRELLAFAAERDKIALHRDSIASAYDEHAIGRDKVGLQRDVAGSARDRRARAQHRDMDSAFADRALAGTDRDYGAGDRGDSYDDRARSRRARDHAADTRSHAADDRDRAADKAAQQEQELAGLRLALESRTVIGQAQGLVMAEHQLSAQSAFALLTRLSQHSNTKLYDIAVRLVAAADPGEE